MYTLITTVFQGKKYEIFVPFQNGGEMTVISILAKILKTTFPKEFFN